MRVVPVDQWMGWVSGIGLGLSLGAASAPWYGLGLQSGNGLWFGIGLRSMVSGIWWYRYWFMIAVNVLLWFSPQHQQSTPLV